MQRCTYVCGSCAGRLPRPMAPSLRWCHAHGAVRDAMRAWSLEATEMDRVAVYVGDFLCGVVLGWSGIERLIRHTANQLPACIADRDVLAGAPCCLARSALRERAWDYAGKRALGS